MKSIHVLARAFACLSLAALGTGANAAGQAPDSPNQSRADQDPEETDGATTQEETASRSPVPATAGRRDSRYRVEVGVLPRYISNYFQTQDDFNSATTATPREAAYVTTLSGSFEYDFLQERERTLTGGVRVRRNLFADLDGADSTDIDVTLDYNLQQNQLRLGYFGTPRRLASVTDGGNVYGETNGLRAEYLRRFSRRLRARGGYEFTRETFSRFDERDLSRHQISGDVRYQLSPYFTPGVGFEYVRANAESENFSYKRPALVLLATSRIGDVAYSSLRYRYSDRDYTTDLATGSNFGREDRRHDLSFYSTVQLRRGFSLFGFANHTNNNSNRPNRGFRSYEAGLGLFLRFP
jgi:hypothetical protein